MFDLSIQNEIVSLTMNHGKVNAMDIEFCRELRTQFRSLASDHDCRALILQGKPGVFSAGIDLKRWLAEPADYVVPFLEELEGLFVDAFTFPKPTVSMIEGPAVAGGCMLAAACDFRVIGPEATIGIPEMRVGVALPMAAIEIMRFVANNQAFQEVVLRGKMYRGSEAVNIGLASQCVPTDELPGTAHEIAGELAAIPSEAFRMTKRQSRLPVSDSIARLQQVLGQEYNQIWQAETTRRAIDRYVTERLSK